MAEAKLERVERVDPMARVEALGATIVSQPKMANPRESRSQNLKIWDRRTQALRSSGMTPSNFTEEDPFYVSGPKELMAKVRFLWISDIIMRKNPILTGWKISIYEPVTKAIAEEMRLEVRTNDFTPDGAFRAGDAVLHWTPEEVAKEHDLLFLRGANTKSVAERASAEFQAEVGQSGGVPMGNITVTADANEMAEAEQRQRSDISSSEQQAIKGY